MSKSTTESACSVSMMQRNTKKSQLNPGGLNWEWIGNNLGMDWENEA